MGALPKRRHSTMRKGRRKKSIQIKINNLIKCSVCGNLKEAHKLCLYCNAKRKLKK